MYISILLFRYLERVSEQKKNRNYSYESIEAKLKFHFASKYVFYKMTCLFEHDCLLFLGEFNLNTKDFL